MKKNNKILSVVLAVKNEEENIRRCLDSIKEIADEIIVFDEYSKDKTRDIAKQKGAQVFKYQHKINFHETKQKAIDKASGDWILQLDADEIVSADLADEINVVISTGDEDLQQRIFRHSEDEVLESEESLRSLHSKNLSRDDEKKIKLFKKYQKLIEQRDGRVGNKDGEVVAFFIPRKNIFLGAPMTHGGVYPDAVIRLIKRGKARLPGKSVHELMEVDGQVGWLFNDLLHYDSPTFTRYYSRWQRYTELIADDFKLKFRSKNNLINFVKYVFIKPISEFFLLYIRHKGVLDGYRGFIWSFFSAIRFPASYIKFLRMN